MKATATRPSDTPSPRADEAFTCCETPLPWPTRAEDRTCPECGTVWEHDGIDLGAGARIKPVPAAYEAQLAERAAEMLPDLTLAERLELLGAMSPEDMSTCLASIATMYPQAFDFSIVRDRALAGRLTTVLVASEDEDDEDQPHCRACGAGVGIFMGHGDGWHHFSGAGTPEAGREGRTRERIPARDRRRDRDPRHPRVREGRARRPGVGSVSGSGCRSNWSSSMKAHYAAGTTSPPISAARTAVCTESQKTGCPGAPYGRCAT